jgi:hypothetical protein
MKILWVEDFGDKLARSTIVIEIFEDLFEGVALKKVYNSDNPQVEAQLPELFREHTLHEIYVCQSYVEWKKVDEQHAGDFDVALIDINLVSYQTPSDEMPEGIDHPEFDKKAGFYIYHQLIKRGFPDANIAFFTGQKQSLKDFARYCGDIFLDRPAHCFEKSPAHFIQLRRWLSEKAGQQSLILRRGIIEGCRFMKERVKAIDSQELEARLIFYKTTVRNINADPEAYRRETINYLTRLERFFLPHQSYDKADLFNQFTKELVAKWGEESRGHFIRTKGAPRSRTWLEDQFHKTAQFQMKMLRNWSSHVQLSTELTAREAAYFFMLAMRSWVESDLNEIFRYEEILSTLFPVLPEPELNRLIHSGLEFHLERSYEQLRALHTDVLRQIKVSSEEKRGAFSMSRRIDNYFLAMFRELGEALDWLDTGAFEFNLRKVRDASLGLFYQSFWHGLFPMQIKTTFYANLQSVKFNVEPLSESFLSFLGQMIFKECFEEKEVAASVA